MATELSGSNYSEVDSSNNNAAPNGMPEGMAPSGVNDAWRQHVGATKRAWDRDHATATVGGTGNAITLAYTTGPTSYVTGEKFTFLATAANTGATTVNVSGLGAKNVFKKTSAGVAACVGGEIQTGDIVELEYDGTQFQLISSSPTFAVGQLTNSLGGNVNLNNTSNYFDGPSVAQGTSGTWFVSGTVSLNDAAGAANFGAKLWDGTTVIASANVNSGGTNQGAVISLSGVITSPAGNLRISARDFSSTSGQMYSNNTGAGKDSTITAFRIA